MPLPKRPGPQLRLPRLPRQPQCGIETVAAAAAVVAAAAVAVAATVVAVAAVVTAVAVAEVVNPILPMPDISEKPAMPNATGSMALL